MFYLMRPKCYSFHSLFRNMKNCSRTLVSILMGSWGGSLQVRDHEGCEQRKGVNGIKHCPPCLVLQASK